MRELFPYTFGHVPTWFGKPDYAVIYNWLEIEVEEDAEMRLPILAEIAGHRNREVRNYVRERFAEDWDREIALKLYGAYEIANVEWSRNGRPRFNAPLRLV